VLKTRIPRTDCRSSQTIAPFRPHTLPIRVYTCPS